MLFSDESRFCVDHTDGRFRVMERDRWDGANIMVWGGIAYGERTQLVVLNFQDNGPGRRLRSIKCFGLMWFRFSLNIRGIISSRITRGLTVLFLLRTFFKPMEFMYWTDQPSPPTSLQESIFWDELGRRIHNRRRQPTNVNELQAALGKKWNNMPQAFINRLINSMRRCCTAVVNADGGHTWS